MIIKKNETTKGHRLFVAVPVTKILQEEILRWEMQYTKLPVRWLQGKNLHITLIPPWYENDLPAAIDLFQTFQEKGLLFDPQFTRTAFGPNPESPRLVWAEGPTPPAILTLKLAIEEIFGVVPERRPFLLHLTLARFNPEDFSAFPIKKINDKINWQDKAQKIVLMESHLARTGADYEIVSSIDL